MVGLGHEGGELPWTLLVVAIASWIQREQQAAIVYLLEENRVLKARLRGRKLRFTDDERCRLAVKGKELCGTRTVESCSIETARAYSRSPSIGVVAPLSSRDPKSYSNAIPAWRLGEVASRAIGSTTSHWTASVSSPWTTASPRRRRRIWCSFKTGTKS